jgi:hypothetical protein
MTTAYFTSSLDVELWLGMFEWWEILQWLFLCACGFIWWHKLTFSPPQAHGILILEHNNTFRFRLTLSWLWRYCSSVWIKFSNDGKSVLWTATKNHIYWMHMEMKRPVCAIIADFFFRCRLWMHNFLRLIINNIIPVILQRSGFSLEPSRNIATEAAFLQMFNM